MAQLHLHAALHAASQTALVLFAVLVLLREVKLSRSDVEVGHRFWRGLVHKECHELLQQCRDGPLAWLHLSMGMRVRG